MKIKSVLLSATALFMLVSCGEGSPSEPAGPVQTDLQKLVAATKDLDTTPKGKYVAHFYVYNLGVAVRDIYHYELAEYVDGQFVNFTVDEGKPNVKEIDLQARTLSRGYWVRREIAGGYFGGEQFNPQNTSSVTYDYDNLKSIAANYTEESYAEEIQSWQRTEDNGFMLSIKYLNRITYRYFDDHGWETSYIDTYAYNGEARQHHRYYDYINDIGSNIINSNY